MHSSSLSRKGKPERGGFPAKGAAGIGVRVAKSVPGKLGIRYGKWQGTEHPKEEEATWECGINGDREMGEPCSHPDPRNFTWICVLL